MTCLLRHGLVLAAAIAATEIIHAAEPHIADPAGGQLTLPSLKTDTALKIWAK